MFDACSARVLPQQTKPLKGDGVIGELLADQKFTWTQSPFYPMWEKIVTPMYRLWLHGLSGLHALCCPLSKKGCYIQSLTHFWIVDLMCCFIHHLTSGAFTVIPGSVLLFPCWDCYKISIRTTQFSNFPFHLCCSYIMIGSDTFYHWSSPGAVFMQRVILYWIGLLFVLA